MLAEEEGRHVLMITPRAERGFTLIEMMIAITLIGILLGIGIPAMRDWMMNTQIKTAAESFTNAMQLARAEAVRRNTNVQFTLGANASWTVGCQTPVADGDGDGDGVDDCPAAIQSHPASETKKVTVNVTPGGADMLTFSPLGRVTGNIDNSDPITQLDVTVPDSDIDPGVRRDLRVIISGGSVRMCNPNVTIANDPRICP